jgi:hypothetical protein
MGNGFFAGKLGKCVRFSSFVMQNAQYFSTFSFMIKRQIERHFKWASLNFPIVAVLGPRQAGYSAKCSV